MGEVYNGNFADGKQSFMNIVFSRQGERRREGIRVAKSKNRLKR
jgi:hypothetical protein